MHCPASGDKQNNGYRPPYFENTTYPFITNGPKGDVRTIVTRVGFETGEVQVVLVTAKETLPNKDEIVKAIQNRLPEVKSIIQNVNGARTSVIFGDKTQALRKPCHSRSAR